IFSPLSSGTYTIHIKDDNNCVKDTVVTIEDSINVHADILMTPALCYNTSTGSLTVNGTNAFAPYTYGLGNNPISTNNVFNNLSAGNYIIHVLDSNGC